MGKKKSERSVFLNQRTFDVHIQNHGSFEAIHVQVREWETPRTDPDTILITRDALDAEEFDVHIDELIELLNDLRAVGRRKLAVIKRRAEKKKASRKKAPT